MKRHIWIISLLIIGVSFLSAEDIDDPFKRQYFLFSQFMIETLPGAYFFPAFFENYAPDTTFLIEENSGFSFIDPPYVYFEGDSHLQFKWSVNGFQVNSALNPGSPSILIPFSAVNRMTLKGETPQDRDSGINFVATLPKESTLRVMVSNVWPHMRGFIPGAEFWINPHATIENRNNVLYSGRRKIRSNIFADVFYNKELNGSYLSMSLNYLEMKREFNDFNSFNEMFTESAISLLLHSQYLIPFENGFFKAEAALNTLERDRANSELGRLPQETYYKDRLAFFTGFHLQSRGLDLKASFTHENEESEPFVMNFAKDLMDNDGDGMFPFEKWGKFSASVAQFQFFSPLLSSQQEQFAGVDIFFDFKYTFLKGIEESFDFNPILFNGSPYLIYLWQGGSSFENQNLHGKAGTIISASISQDFAVYLKFIFQYSSLSFDYSENNLSRFGIGYDLGIHLFETRKTNVLISYSHTPYELRENVNFFLETQRPSAMIHTWNDLNQDLQYQSGEEGSLYGFSGGPYHSLDSGLEIPSHNRLLIDLKTRLSPKLLLQVKGLYKQMVNNLWVEFGEEYGFYETVDEKELYFFQTPFREFVLTNEGFEENPFYLQLHLHLRSQNLKKWIFSFSFMAHIGMGQTAFGNGPAANDIGVLDESQANPNTWINGYGRVDGDRAYVAKFFIGFTVLPRLFLTANIKYRDGNPFAFFDSHYAHDQWVITYKTIQAEDSRGRKGGPREDYLTDVSLKVTYSLKILDHDVDLFITMFNLLDFGSELSEYIFSGGWRYANELQIPRSLRAGIVIKL